MPLIATRGAASVQGFGEFAQATAANYIEDVFSTYLYSGTGSAQTITNGIDLAGKGGLVWSKVRNNSDSHWLGDTVRGTGFVLESQSDNQSRALASYTSFNSNGYSITQAGTDLSGSGKNYVSWTFREQPKFFDIVTFSGNGGTQNIAHNLGSVPGCVIVKFVSGSAGVGNWPTWHRGLDSGKIVNLNLTGGQGGPFPTYFGNNTITVDPTSTQFTVGSNANVNGSGSNYVAYIFAHNAGGFGLTGTDNVISCGSVVGASQVEVNLGYEPQWILVKNASAAQDWWVVDNMRGLPVQAPDTSYNASNLRPNLSDAETTGFSIAPSATGFKANVLTASQTYIYIAIRRGPMKVPTTGTSVFAIDQNTSSPFAMTSGFPVDSWWYGDRSGSSKWFDFDRLRGNFYLQQNTTAAESAFTVKFDNMTGVALTSSNATGYIQYAFRRAPSFFDEVCYTGTGSAATINHNLTVVPELIIIKNRGSGNWAVNVRSINTNNWILNLEEDTARFNNALFSSAPTSTTMTFTGQQINVASNTYVAYLFATCAGVSKVGSYTGTGATQTINCGFTGGARFVLVKATSTTGSWYVWDTARGMIPSNDPYLVLNTTAAEVTGTDWVDTAATGFELSNAGGNLANSNGVSYIFLAIA